MEVIMFRKLFRGIFKLCAYSVVLIILAGVWDYTQQRQAVAGEFTVATYATSVSDRYGPHVAQITTLASNGAEAGISNGLDWVKSAGVLDSQGVEPTVLGRRVVATQEPQEVKTLNEQVVLASVNSVAAPETSLYPRARALQ
jgi:hypothetical protein